MPWGLTWLDAALLLILVMFLVAGYRRGFWVTLGTMAGLIAGAIASFFSIPLVSSWVNDPAWRWVAIIAAAILLIVVGQAIGAAIGRWIRLRLSLPALRTADRLAGAVANTVVAAALIGLLAFSAGTMGVPSVTSAVSQSRVISTINKVAPRSDQGHDRPDPCGGGRCWPGAGDRPAGGTRGLHPDGGSNGSAAR